VTRLRNRTTATPAAAELVSVISDLAHDGRGIARVDGKVTFIAGALPGERVRWRLRRPGRQADEGELLEVEAASPDRVAPACAHFGVCGGCSLQHLALPAQRRFKEKQLLDALGRIGRVQPDAVAPPVTGPDWGYRRRARLSVKHVAKKGGVLVGFREADSPFVAQLQACETLDPRVGRKLREIAACVERLHDATLVPQIEVAAAARVALVFRVMRPPTAEDLEVLRAFGREHGFDIHLQTGGLDTVKALDSSAPPLTLSPDGSALALAFRPTDFVQVNDAVNQQMVRQALAWLGLAGGAAAAGLAPWGPPQGRFGQPPPRRPRILELFSGLGNFTLPLAAAGAEVVAVEGEAGLVERGRANAKANGLEVKFHVADLSKPDPHASWLTDDYDAVLVDPPRAGAREVLPLVTRGGEDVQNLGRPPRAPGQGSVRLVSPGNARAGRGVPGARARLPAREGRHPGHVPAHEPRRIHGPVHAWRLRSSASSW
jgi:23S rRNA (uracil1939-C5)-methyltransferase